MRNSHTTASTEASFQSMKAGFEQVSHKSHVAMTGDVSENPANTPTATSPKRVKHSPPLKPLPNKCLGNNKAIKPSTSPLPCLHKPSLRQRFPLGNGVVDVFNPIRVENVVIWFVRVGNLETGGEQRRDTNAEPGRRRRMSNRQPSSKWRCLRSLN